MHALARPLLAGCPRALNAGNTAVVCSKRLEPRRQLPLAQPLSLLLSPARCFSASATSSNSSASKPQSQAPTTPQSQEQPQLQQQQPQQAHSQPAAWEIVYEGALSNTLRRLKQFSLGSCIISTVSAPILVLLGSADVPFATRVGLGATVLTFGVFTTTFMNWMMSSYVSRAYIPVQDGKPDILRLETYNFLAQPVVSEMKGALRSSHLHCRLKKRKKDAFQFTVCLCHPFFTRPSIKREPGYDAVSDFVLRGREEAQVRAARRARYAQDAAGLGRGRAGQARRAQPALFHPPGAHHAPLLVAHLPAALRNSGGGGASRGGQRR